MLGDDAGVLRERFFREPAGGEHRAAFPRSNVSTFPDQFFDGALIWDALQFLISPLLEQTVARLLRVMRPGGLMLVFFNADEKLPEIPLYNYRIQDSKTLLQIPRGGSQRGQHFNSRMLERLFEKASSLKFFLTRDHLREVIVRR